MGVEGSLEEAETITIAVASDLHVYSSVVAPEEPPSYLCVSAAGRRPTRDPIEGLLELFAEHELSADLLLCPGDIANRADPVALEYGWQRLLTVGQALDARVIATAGNHDVDSRHIYYPGEASTALKALRPHFPIASTGAAHEYWSSHFMVVEDDHWRLVTLNSAAHHDGEPNETNHGRITAETLELLGARLAASEHKALNILLCHHHPHQHADAGEEDASLMVEGHLLLRLLDEAKCGRWIVIHGHKHVPHLSYAAADGSQPPIVLCAGSLSANLRFWGQSSSRNQFYLLDFPVNLYNDLELEAAGTFRTWNWADNFGWRPARNDFGLPPRGGFGYHRQPQSVAADLSGIVQAFGQPFMEWGELVEAEPRVRFLSPRDLEDTLDHLINDQGRKIAYDRFGSPVQIS